MEQHKAEALISRLEKFASDKPRQYLASVIIVSLLGFGILAIAVGLAMLNVVLLVGVVFLVVVTGGKALILFAKLGKLLFILAIPAWTMIKSSFTLLATRFPKPQGRELTKIEAPALFARLEELRVRMNGQRIHRVLLNNELNAAIVQHPRFGLLGWEENYLILGLPLLLTLDENEALAVVAHECGHLSGYHGRLGGFIYRFRSAWGRLQQLSEQWNDWGSRLIARMFRWYGPYFNAYTFVFARQNEYVADKTSVDIAGRQSAANALMRISIAAQFEQDTFWPSIQQRVIQEPEPLHDRSTFWENSLRSSLDETRRVRFLDIARQRKTDHFDTHPALQDRLAAMGVAIDLAAARQLESPTRTAAAVWLDASLKLMKSEFDEQWRRSIAEQWHTRHVTLRQQQERLSQLEANESPSQDDAWEKIRLLDQLKPEFDLLPMLNSLLTLNPDHQAARFRRGRLLVANRDEAGVADLEAVMEIDADAIVPGCEIAYHYYLERDSMRANQYLRRLQERSTYLAQVRKELDSLPSDSTLVAAELAEDTLEAIRRILKEHGKYIHRAYLLKRILKTDSQIGDFVLAFETSWFNFGDKGPVVIKNLVDKEFPLRMFIVHLGSRTYRGFRKKIKKIGVAPLMFR